jgi:WD40 repeat protein
VNRVLISNDDELVVTSSWDRTLRVWSLKERRCVAVFDAHPGTIEQLSKSVDRALLFTFGGVLKIVSLRDGSLIAAFEGDKQIITCAADPQIEWVVARDQGGQMHFFHCENGP